MSDAEYGSKARMSAMVFIAGFVTGGIIGMILGAKVAGPTKRDLEILVRHYEQYPE